MLSLFADEAFSKANDDGTDQLLVSPTSKSNKIIAVDVARMFLILKWARFLNGVFLNVNVKKIMATRTCGDDQCFFITG